MGDQPAQRPADPDRRRGNCRRDGPGQRREGETGAKTPAVAMTGQVDDRDPVVIDQRLGDIFLDPGMHSPAMRQHHLRPRAGGVDIEGWQMVDQAVSTTGILPIFIRHSFGPVLWTLEPFESTATVTGISLTSNS